MSVEHNVLETKPWRNEGNWMVDVRGRSMLRKEESNLLYFLARDYCTAAGALIDAGALIGASSSCLCGGLRDRSDSVAFVKSIHAFDKFKADEPYLVNYLKTRVDENISEGDDFVGVYEKNTLGCQEYIEIHQGDFMDVVWTGDPIELLFVDIAKTQQLNSHLIKEFFPALIPGKSLLVHQDYHHPHLPYIHVSMEYLSQYFEIVDYAVNDSILFMNVEKIPHEMIRRCAAWDFDREEQVELMDRAIKRLPEELRYHAVLAKVMLVWKLIGGDHAKSELVIADRITPESYKRTDEHWARYRDQVASRIGI